MYQIKISYKFLLLFLVVIILLCNSCSSSKEKGQDNSVIFLENTQNLTTQQIRQLFQVAIPIEKIVNSHKGYSLMPLYQSVDFLMGDDFKKDSVIKYLKVNYPISLSVDEVSGNIRIKVSDLLDTLLNPKDVTKRFIDLFAEKMPLKETLQFDYEDDINYYLSQLGKVESDSGGVSYLWLRKTFRELVRTDSSKSRDLQLRKVLKEVGVLAEHNSKMDILQAEIHLQLEEYSQAFNILKKLYKNGDEAAKVSFLLSKFSKNRLKIAGMDNKDILKKNALRLMPPDFELLRRLGEEFYRDALELGYNKKYAGECYTILATIFPENLFYKSRLSFVKFMESDLLTATELMEECIVKDPLNPNYYYHYGTQRYYLDKKDKSEVIDIFNKAITLGDSLDSYLYLGKIYFEQGDYDKALYNYRERVKNSFGKKDKLKYQALKGIRNSLKRKKELAKSDSLKK